jgi:CBS domain-containing protein
VEDHQSRLVGLISYRALIHVMASGMSETKDEPLPVSGIMKKNPVTVSPETSTLEAISIMRRLQVGCLPVVKDGRLIGMVTERDFMGIASELLEQKLNE